jgi:branched-chain amino acid transport system ATP-binding protein
MIVFAPADRIAKVQEQKARAALALAHQAYVLATGSVVLGGPGAALRQDLAVRRAYLGG